MLLQQFFFASNILQTNHFLIYNRLSAITLLLRIRYYGPTMVVRPHKLLEMLRKSNHYLQYWITQKTSKRNERTYSWCENQTLLPDLQEKYITANRERCESNYGRFRITRDTPYFVCCIRSHAFPRKKIFHKLEETVSCTERLEKNNNWTKYNIIVKG